MEITEALGRTHRMDAETYFNQVYETTSRKLMQHIIIQTSNAADVDDIFQNVYHEFYSRILRKGFADISFPMAFLNAIAEKQLARHYRAKASKQQNETDLNSYDDLIPMADEDFAELISIRDALESARQAVREMPLESYKCFTLYYFYDMPVSEIATRLQLTKDGVKSRL